MIDDEKFALLSARALAWAKSQEDLILKFGSPLSPLQAQDAKRAGVRDINRVRVLVVDRISPPDDEELADAALRAHIITDASHSITVGHGIAIRASAWQDRTLLVHSLVHVAQCERSGGLDSFVQEYLSDRHTSPDFSIGMLEEEARGVARRICEDETVGNFGQRQN